MKELRKKKVGRPFIGSKPLLLMVPPDELAALDEWMSEQSGYPRRVHFETRQEAIRWLVRMGIASGARSKKE